MDAYIVYAKRTPIGKFAGSLSTVRVDDLLAMVLTNAKNSLSFAPELIEDVIVGCANQAGEDNRNLARMSSVLAGLPFEVPGVTLNRLCGSSLDAVADAACKINSGYQDCILVGGAESMSRAPYVMSKSPTAFGRAQKIWDTAIGWRFQNPKMEKLFPLYSMGETAEEVASLHHISRQEQDEFAMNSHEKAVRALKNNEFVDETLPIEVNMRKSTFTFEKDEGPREDSTINKLSKLKAVFRAGGTVTAGNSSSINDGAAAVLVVSEKFMKAHGLKPLAKITGMGVRGCHPNTMGLGPIFATQKLLQKFNKKISDFAVIELNEAFAAQSLACIKELGAPMEKVNPRGGAIALGHPLGASGARILTTLIHQLGRGQQGLATMCIGVGQGVALSIERC